MPYLLEIACFNPQSALIAQTAGADRIELCDNVAEGGTTPSMGMLQEVRQQIHLPLHVMIAPRGGDYCYSQLEWEAMYKDVLFCKSIGIDGVVIGVLNADYTVDAERCATLVAAAYPMSVTFHRAFDHTPDPLAALQTLIGLGFDRILTSGQQPNALQGAPLISSLIQAANHDILVMPGGGVRASNLLDIATQTGAMEFHSAASLYNAAALTAPSGLTYQAPTLTDADLVQAMKTQIIQLNQAGEKSSSKTQ